MDVDVQLQEIDSIEKLLKSKNLIPSPEGILVFFHKEGSDAPEHRSTASIIRVEMTGKLELLLLDGRGVTVKGVFYEKHPTAVQKRANRQRLMNGTWSYVDESWIRPEHYERHRNELINRKAKLEEMVKQAADAEALRQRILSEAAGVVHEPKETAKT